MKTIKFYFLSIALLLAAATYGQQNWVPISSDTPQNPVVTVIEQNTNNVIIDVEIPGMYVTPVEVNGTIYQRIELYSWQTTKDIGKPELPMINEIIGMPSGKKIKASIMSLATTLLEDYNIFPFQTPSKDVAGGQSDEFVIDKAFYKQSTSYPASNVSVDKPGIWRDVKISGLHVTPFIYNPAQLSLEVIHRLRIKVEFYDIDTEVTVNRSKDLNHPIFKMYASKILNFESLGYTMNNRDSDDIKYLIITNTNPLSTLESFIDWKNRQGFRVEVRTMEAGFNTPQDFKDYIGQLYTSDNLEYVLMVGDAYPNGGNNPGDPDDVPMFWWQPSGEDGSYSDTWYVCLDGPDDHFADLAIGRFTYDNLDELALQLDKTLDFYKEPDSETNWAENTILVAHEEQYPAKYTQCKNEIENYSYALQIPIFEECYGGAGASNQDIIDYINANSCGIFNYRGHGSATEFWQWCPSGSFTNAHIQQLTNQDRLFVLFDVCCDNMDIVAFAGDCLCESFMKSPVASVAINGAIIPSYTIPNHDYDKEMYKAVFEEGIYNIGYVTNYANITVVNNHGTIGRSNVRTYLWLGDASIEPWTLQPMDLIVDHLPTLFLGTDEFNVEVENSSGPVEGARVCLTNDDLSVYALGFTDATGEVVLDLGGPVLDPGTATITVSYHNHLPYQMDIPIIPAQGPYIVFTDYDIDDATGNNNGFADFGEQINLDVTLENIGLDTAMQVVTTITAIDDYLTILDSVHEWGMIPGNSFVVADSAFSMDIALDAPDQHVVSFDMIIEDLNSDQVWIEDFDLLLNAPVLDILEMVIDDSQNGNNNGRLDPGENAIIKVKNKNTGHCPAENTVASIETMSQYLTMHNTVDTIATLGLLGYKYAEFEVDVDPDAPNGVVFAEFDYLLCSGIFEEEKSFTRKIGLLVEDWETGDFTSFNWQHSGDQPWEITMLFPYEGQYHARSADINDSETSVLSLSMEIMTADTIYFWRKVSSQASDELKFYIDNDLMGNWSGIGSYAEEKYRVETGTHTFKWVYQKNSSGSSGSDAAWIDFIIMPPRMTLTCYAGPDASICAGDEYQCHGAATDWDEILWTSSGTGTFDDPTILEPVYTPSADDIANGSVELTITVENTDGTADDEMMLAILDVPAVPETPDGPDYVDLMVTTSSDYTIATVPYANEYSWHIDPLEAGTISGNTNTGNVQWNLSYLGSAMISVMAINDCGDSEYSEEYQVTVDNTTGIHELVDGIDVHIYPNPSMGTFMIDLNSGSEQSIEIRVFNALGDVVYTASNVQFSGKLTKTLDFNSFAEGMYFLQINTHNKLLTKKLIINR